MIKSHYCKVFITAFLFSCYTPYSLAVVNAGKAMITVKDVEATSKDNEDKRRLKRRSSVFVNDTVITGSESRAQLRMVDGSLIALKENTELIISQYNFNSADKKNSAVLNLVTGGLRSITGSIKADKGEYQLNTPVGSIGIRGTHYQVEILNDTLWLAVWDGAIDVALNIGSQAGSTLSLGTTENYPFASIDTNGSISTFIEPPEVFEQGMSSTAKEIINHDNAAKNTSTSSRVNRPAPLTVEEESSISSAHSQFTSGESDTELIVTALDEGYTEFVSFDELDLVESKNIAELVAAKQGFVEYSHGEVTSTEYNLSNFSAGMAIDFDSGRISNGQLSFNDDKSTEQWNAVFNGNMNIKNENVILEVGITFASHGNNIADGTISAGFVDFLGLDGVSGSFELFEENQDVRVGGSYLIKP